VIANTLMQANNMERLCSSW